MKRVFLAILICSISTLAFAQNIDVKKKGGINPKEWKANESATISINRIPTTIEEFKQVQSEIGTTPEGAVMLQLLAMEMYNQNPTVGTECIKLNNIQSNQSSVLSRMPEIFSKKDMNYARPHLVATFFNGSTPQNGFNPKNPYTIQVRTRANMQYQRSEMMRGYVLYLEVYSSGYQTSPWRSVEVIKQKGSEFFQVSNSPALYVQCMDVDFDSDRDYEGLK
ncbi:MAG: hypothetical protein KBT29_01450 [Prevotellaceae bacterium]|nr:hypothetical protein [Candidatus Minthosoma caballi]